MCKHCYHVPLVALAPSSCCVLLQTSWGASCFVSCTLHPSKKYASVFSTTHYKFMSTPDASDFQYNCDEIFTDLCQCDLAAFLADGLFEQCLLTTISAELPPRNFLNSHALRSQSCTVLKLPVTAPSRPKLLWTEDASWPRHAATCLRTCFNDSPKPRMLSFHHP